MVIPTWTGSSEEDIRDRLATTANYFSCSSSDAGDTTGVQDINWADKGWTTSNNSTFRQELCQFFANNLSVVFPDITSFNIVLFRGIPPTQTYTKSIAYCYIGNDLTLTVTDPNGLKEAGIMITMLISWHR